MLPQACIALPALPITANGKLDRRALPAPADLAAPSSFAEPEGPLEQRLAALWQQTLGVPRVGRHDSFFDLGGHSLLAIAMVERLRQDGWHLELASVFAEPTLAALAAACTPLGEDDDAAGAPAPIPAGIDRLSPALLPPSLALTQAQLDAIAAQVPGGAANIQDICPLGPLQQGMLFHHLRQAQGDVFLTPFVLAFQPTRPPCTAPWRACGRWSRGTTSCARPWSGRAWTAACRWCCARPICRCTGCRPGRRWCAAALQAALDPAWQRLDLAMRRCCAWCRSRRRHTGAGCWACCCTTWCWTTIRCGR
jgi:aryl carrier-like protein